MTIFSWENTTDLGCLENDDGDVSSNAHLSIHRRWDDFCVAFYNVYFPICFGKTKTYGDGGSSSSVRLFDVRWACPSEEKVFYHQ